MSTWYGRCVRSNACCIFDDIPDPCTTSNHLSYVSKSLCILTFCHCNQNTSHLHTCRKIWWNSNCWSLCNLFWLSFSIIYVHTFDLCLLRITSQTPSKSFPSFFLFTSDLLCFRKSSFDSPSVHSSAISWSDDLIS